MAARQDRSPKIQNRKARHRYEVLEALEVGIQLQGTEVKSLRLGQCSLDEAFARVEDQTCILYGCHIATYPFGNVNNHEPLRPRRLLLKKREIIRLGEQATQDRLTLVPTALYWKNGLAKIELALCKGKNVADKRDSMKTQDSRRDIAQALRDRRER